MSPYLVVFMIPEKITSCMAPCVDIPPLPLNFQWMLMPILQLSGRLLPKAYPSVVLQLDC